MAIDWSTLIAFAFVAAAIVVSPGPDTMLILRNSLLSSRAAGLATVLGVQAGLFVHTALAVVGLTALIASYPGFLQVISVAGAGYLAWLGLRAITGGDALVVNGTDPVRSLPAFRDGALCNLLNPKVLVLFLALYPNFLSVDKNVPAQIALLSTALICLNSAWQVFLVSCARLARPALTRPGTLRVIGVTSGLAFIAFACAMIIRQVN